MATHSSILAWKSPRTEEPGGLYSTRLQRVRQDWILSIFWVNRIGKKKKKTTFGPWENVYKIKISQLIRSIWLYFMLSHCLEIEEANEEIIHTEELSNNGGVLIKEFQNCSHSERCVLISSLLGSLKQHKFILLQCYRSEVWHESHWVKTKMSAMLYSF